jgi:outer membrane protein assembly factor BamB
VDLVVPARRRVYVGGNFKRIGGSRRAGLAAVDSRTGAAAQWMPSVRTERLGAVGVSGTGRVAIGLWESGLRGLARTGLAAIDTASGRVTKWNPRISGGDVEGVAVAGETVFIAGKFTRVGAHRRNGLAAIDRRNGRTLPWNPRTGGRWDAIAFANGVVYVAHEDDNHENGSLLSAIDARSGRTLWERSLNDTWLFGDGGPPLAAVGSTVYVADTRDVHVVDAATGRMDDVPVNTKVLVLYNALVATDDLLYVATSGSEVAAANGVTAVDVSTGEKRWHIAGNGAVMTLALDRSILYLGGYFHRVGGQARTGLAAVDAETGELKRWQPKNLGGIEAMQVVGPRLYVSGDFDGHLASVPLAGPRG